MRKLLFSIGLLIFLNIISYLYLLEIVQGQETFVFKPEQSAFIIQKKDIILDDTADFEFDDYFLICSFANYLYRYEFTQDYLKIRLDGKDYFYPYKISEKEVEVVEKVVVKEVYVQTSSPVQETGQVDEDDYEENYFVLLKDHCRFEAGSDMSDIISTIQSCVSTNMRTTVDYSQLNPNQIGYYSVFFITDEQKYEISIEIY